MCKENKTCNLSNLNYKSRLRIRKTNLTLFCKNAPKPADISCGSISFTPKKLPPKCFYAKFFLSQKTFFTPKSIF